jgi:hypothetical protein
METLYPIVRRVRRPLLVVVGNVEAVKVIAATPPHPDPLPPGEGTADETARVVGERSRELSQTNVRTEAAGLRTTDNGPAVIDRTLQSGALGGPSRTGNDALPERVEGNKGDEENSKQSDAR